MRGVEVMPLFNDPFLFANHKNSRWIGTIDELTDIKRLPDESVLLLDDGHCLRDHALQACHINANKHVSQFGATSLQTLLQMVDSDIGVTFIPEMARDSLMLQGSDIELHSMPAESRREIGLVWRKGSARVEEFQMLGSILQQLKQQD